MESPTNGNFGYRPKKDTGRKETGVELWINDFMHYLQHRRGATKSTLDTYRCILREFGKYIGDRDITLKEIDQWAYVLSARNYSPKTYRCKLSVVKSLVKYLYSRDLVEIKPEAIELPKARHTEATFLDFSEAHRMIRCCKKLRDRAILMVLLSTGVRVSELVDLRYEDLFEQSIIVRHGKGDKPRVVFITKETQAVIDEYIKCQRGGKDGYLFPNPHGDRISRQYIARIVHDYALKAGITKKVSTHTMRHTMATSMLRNGARVEDVQQILGHNSINTTMLYLHFTAPELQKAYNKATQQRSPTKLV